MRPRPFYPAPVLTLGGLVVAPESGQVLRAAYPFEQALEAFQAAAEVPGKTWIRLT